jgi:hypothetical protein
MSKRQKSSSVEVLRCNESGDVIFIDAQRSTTNQSLEEEFNNKIDLILERIKIKKQKRASSI